MADFPCHLHKAGGLWIEVRTPAERDEKLAEGWSVDQVFAEIWDPLQWGATGPAAPTPDPPVVPDAPKRGRPKKAV